MSCLPYMNLEEKITSVEIFGDDISNVLIVEGKTDVKIYERMLMLSKLDWSNIDIVIGKNKNEILKKHDSGDIPFNYFALIDGDFDYYNNNLRDDEKLIYTHFYNIENYLTSYEVLKQTNDDFKTINDTGVQDIEAFIKEIVDSVKPLVLMSLAKMKYNWGFELESCSLERWDYQITLRLTKEQIEDYIFKELTSRGEPFNCSLDWGSLKEELDDYLKENPIDYILNGKQKFEAVYFYFKKLFPSQMNRKRKDSFTVDLCKNLLSSKYVQQIVNTIDDKFLGGSKVKEKVNV